MPSEKSDAVKSVSLFPKANGASVASSCLSLSASLMQKNILPNIVYIVRYSMCIAMVRGNNYRGALCVKSQSINYTSEVIIMPASRLAEY